MRQEDTSIALYYRVAETLKGRMASGRYGPGSILPPEKELSREFNVSNITMRKAMALLVEQGWVLRSRGVGTEVLSKAEDRIPLRITGNFRDWVDSAVNRRLGLQVEVLDTGIVSCPFAVAQIFSVASGTPIWRMKRLRKRKGEPISYYVNYAPPAAIQGIARKDFEKESFIDTFQSKKSLVFSKIEQRVEANVADLDAVRILGMGFGDPLFFVTHTYFSIENAPILVTHMYFRGDRYIYRGEIDLGNPKGGRACPP